MIEKIKIKINNFIVKRYGMEILNLKDIKIKPTFKKINSYKLQQKREFEQKYGFYKETVIVDKYNYLLDGYTTYLLAIEDNLDVIAVTRIDK